MSTSIVTGILSLGDTLIKRFLPDPEQQAKAQLELATMYQSGELQELETRMSAIVAEAKSADPWTSRARPSFLYVIYVMILASIPLGIVSVWWPGEAKAIADGMKDWLAAIPSELWALFGAGYLGYVNKRSDDKARLLGQEVKPGLVSKLLG